VSLKRRYGAKTASAPTTERTFLKPNGLDGSNIADCRRGMESAERRHGNLAVFCWR